MNEDDKNIEFFFDKLIEKQGSKTDKFISTFLSLKKPIRLDYKIDAFLDDLKYAHSDEELFAYNKKMEMFDGVTATFEFQTSGSVQIIDEKFSAELQVNGLGMVEYVKEGRDGAIGDGWYERGRFLFRLYIPPNAVRDIIQKAIIFDNAFTDPENAPVLDALLSPHFGANYEEKGGEGFLKIRLDIVVDDKIADWGGSKKISYKIKKFYM